jgi:hypothetical protein
MRLWMFAAAMVCVGVAASGTVCATPVDLDISGAIRVNNTDPAVPFQGELKYDTSQAPDGPATTGSNNFFQWVFSSGITASFSFNGNVYTGSRVYLTESPDYGGIFYMSLSTTAPGYHPYDLTFTDSTNTILLPGVLPTEQQLFAFPQAKLSSEVSRIPSFFIGFGLAAIRAGFVDVPTQFWLGHRRGQGGSTRRTA